MSVVTQDQPVPVQENDAEEREISLEEANTQNGSVSDAAEVAKAVEKAKAEEVREVLTPKAKVVKWEIGPENLRREYVQRELSFLGKTQWFALVGEVLDKALGGENSMSLNSLFSSPGGRGSLSLDDFRDADMFVQAIAKLLVYAPDFLVKSYCIWLNVPDYERDLAAELMALPADEGGLSDDQGIEIIETFIDQNFASLDRFFREQVAKIQSRFKSQMEQAAAARSPLSSKP
jgi:hypothetical protein